MRLVLHTPDAEILRLLTRPRIFLGGVGSSTAIAREERLAEWAEMEAGEREAGIATA